MHEQGGRPEQIQALVVPGADLSSLGARRFRKHMVRSNSMFPPAIVSPQQSHPHRVGGGIPSVSLAAKVDTQWKKENCAPLDGVDHASAIALTNKDIHVPEGDARIIALHCSEKYAYRNVELGKLCRGERDLYFARLYDAITDVRVQAAFMEREQREVDFPHGWEYDIPQTQLRQDMQYLALPPAREFLTQWRREGRMSYALHPLP